MELQQLFNMTSPDVNISDLIFDALMKSRKLEVCDGVNDFGFWCKIETHEIGFFLKNKVLEVERFGFTVNGNWIDLKTTTSQRYKMKTILDVKLKDLKDAEDYDNEPATFRDMYNETGTKPENFY